MEGFEPTVIRKTSFITASNSVHGNLRWTVE
jgi:hypothetical protein